MSMLRLKTRVVVAVLCFLMIGSSVSNAGRSNSLMDISSDGKWLACSNRDSGTVSIVDLDTNKVVYEVKVGKKPEGVSFIADTYDIAVAVYDDDVVKFIDGKTGRITRSTPVFDEPYGVVSNAAGSVFVTLEYPGKIIQIDPATGEIVKEMSAGSFPRGIALSNDDSQAYVCENFTTIVNAIDLASGKQVDQWQGVSTTNLARQLIVHPKRAKVYLSHIRSRVTSSQGEGAIFPYVSVIDTVKGEDKRRKQMPMDSFFGALVTANPWEVAISPNGRQFLVVFSGTNDMFVCETVDDDYSELKPIQRLNLGNNPRAVRVSPDGTRFYIYNALDFEVVTYDAQQLRIVNRVQVTQNPLSDEMLLGKKLFYSALQPMVGRRWISCSSCHPDGQADSRTWHNPEGLRNTPPLGALAWTHPQHWSADRDETQDFELTIRSQLMQGQGLIRGRVNQALGDTNKGLSKELDALAAYTNSHSFTISPYAKSGLTDSAKRGREVFLSKETGCATCHSGPFYTDSQSGKKSVVHDVGTGGDDPSEKMGPKYDTPTLLGLYRTAPYLHHGRAETLAAVFTTENKNNSHGKTSQLSEQQVSDLVEFLKALPFEDPTPEANKIGLVPVLN